jgi:cytochrome oxidase assembly protein ShyY1
MTSGASIGALLVAAVAVAIAVSLGNWQLRRAQEKLVLQDAWEAAERQPPKPVAAADIAAIGAKLPLQVRIAGRFVHEHELWLDNRQMDGRTGFLLMTPLRLADGAVVLVNRGFVPRDPQDRLRLPPVARPEGEVTVDGLAVQQPPRVLRLGDDAPTQRGRPVIWQNFDLDEFERRSGLRAARWIVQQTGADNDGLLRRWPRPSAGADKHQGYAVQWFSLAALITVLAAYFGYRGLTRRTTLSEPGE